VSEPTVPDAGMSVGALVSDVASDVTRLLRQEVELAKSEIRAEAGKAAKATSLIASGAAALHLVAVLVSVAGVLAVTVVLTRYVPVLADYTAAVAAGGIALVWLILGLAFLGAGRRRLRTISPIPRQTIQSLKEDIAWLRRPNA
jgi:hypothetical protein